MSLEKKLQSTIPNAKDIQRAMSNHEIPEILSKAELENILGITIPYRQSHKKMLKEAIPTFGTLTEAKMEYFLSIDEPMEKRNFTKIFFSGPKARTNYTALVNYAFKHHWIDVQIPEAITYAHLKQFGTPACKAALNIDSLQVSTALRATIEGYGQFTQMKMQYFLDHTSMSDRRPTTEAFFTGEHAFANAANITRFAFENVWKPAGRSVPELVSAEDIKTTIGVAPLRARGLPQHPIEAILADIFEDYGKLDDEKMKLVLNRKTEVERSKFLTIFFSGKHLVDNAPRMVAFAYEYQWKETGTTIPELISVRTQIVNLIGAEALAKLFDNNVSSRELFKRSFPDYGVFNEQKLNVYLNAPMGSQNHLLNTAFFANSENAAQNARKLVRHTYETQWKKEGYELPELLPKRKFIDQLTQCVWHATDIKKFNSLELFEFCFSDYGIITLEKAQQAINSGMMLSYFFFTKSKHAERNSQHYLEAYQRIHEKRLDDLTERDLLALPVPVRELVTKRPRVKSNTRERSAYNAVQIHWSPSLEGSLELMLDGKSEKERITFLRENRQSLWEKLGVTSFSALMKAQSMGLIPKTVLFDDSENTSIPRYRLVDFEGYEFADYATETAPRIEVVSSIDVQAYQSPVHGQFFHTNLPIEYKGNNLTNYNEAEREALSVVGTYLENPNTFTKLERNNGLWALKAPHETYQPSIVPVIINDKLDTTQVIQRRSHAQDPGGVQSAVLQYNNKQLFFFMQEGVGIVR